MTFYGYLFAVGFSAILSWGAWVIVVTHVDPTDAGAVGFLIFYLSLWFALTGTVALAGIGLRRLAQKEEDVVAQTVASFRQGVLVSLLVIVSLLLQSMHALTWWNLSLFIAGLALLEYFFAGTHTTKI